MQLVYSKPINPSKECRCHDVGRPERRPRTRRGEPRTCRCQGRPLRLGAGATAGLSDLSSLQSARLPEKLTVGGDAVPRAAPGGEGGAGATRRGGPPRTRGSRRRHAGRPGGTAPAGPRRRAPAGRAALQRHEEEEWEQERRALGPHGCHGVGLRGCAGTHGGRKGREWARGGGGRGRGEGQGLGTESFQNIIIVVNDWWGLTI